VHQHGRDLGDACSRDVKRLRRVSFSELANFLWSIADLLRGTYKQADYGKVILPMTVLRRLDCVLADTKPKVLEKYAALKGGKVHNFDPILNRITGVPQAGS